MDIESIEIPLEAERSKLYRFFEIMPAILSWTVLASPVILALINPSVAAYFIIAFIVIWILKAGVMALRVFQAYAKMKQRQNLDWQSLLHDVDHVDEALHRLRTSKKLDSTDRWHYKSLLAYKASTQEKLTTKNLYHAVVVAIVDEPMEVVEQSLQALAESHYNLKKAIVYIAYEKRAEPHSLKVATALVKKFKNNFYHMEAIGHPAGIPHEVIGKGGNITYAARKLERYLEKEKIKPEQVLVTTLDSDNQPHVNYLASVAYAFITTPDRIHHSFQPIPMYLNNIWDAPAPTRLIALGSSFWWSIQSVRPHLLRNFSSHAQGMDALIDTDYWSVRTVVEDGHQFWRTYFRYHGKHEVIPTFVPIYQDAVLSHTYRKTLKAQFVQMRRWAYGASDLAYVATNSFKKDCKAPVMDRIFKFFRLLETHISWATAPLILAGAAWAPILASPDGRESIIAHQLPGIASYMQTIAIMGVPSMVFLSLKMLPPRPAHYSRWRRLWMITQWILLPPLSILYGSFSALYSQTRLLLGWYMSKFDVTEKVR